MQMQKHGKCDEDEWRDGMDTSENEGKNCRESIFCYKLKIFY